MNNLQYLSIFLEFVIGVIALMSAIGGKRYMFGLAFTFFVYVVYDLAKVYSMGMLNVYLPVLFLLATISALWSVWSIYKQN